MPPIQSVEDLIAQLRQNPELREQLLSVLLTQELLSLPAEFREFRAEFREITLAHERRMQAIEEQLALQRQEFNEQLAQQRTEFESQLQSLRRELNEQIAQLREEFNQQMARQRAEFNEQMARLRAEFNEQMGLLRAEVHQEIQRTRNELIERMDAIHDAFSSRLDKHERDIARLKGDVLEIRYLFCAKSVFGRFLRPVVAFEPGDFCEKLEDQREIPEEVRNQILNLDVVVQGRRRSDREEVLIAIEVSHVIDMNDVLRAHQRAKALRELGYRAIGSTCGVELTSGARTPAQELGVLVIYDGVAEGVEFLNQLA